MGGLRRKDSPTGVAPPSPRSECRVSFVDEVVTSYSRPLSNDEHWTLYYFEDHALHCPQCFDPLRVHKSGKQLCDKGHDLAIDVARLMFYSRSRDGVFSRDKEEQQEMRVETPPTYCQTLGLLRAIQRALQNGERFVKPKSYDRTYLVSPRHSVPHEAGSSSSEESRSSRQSRDSAYDIKVVIPKEPRRRARRDSLLSDSRRGSLYGEDMQELFRDMKREQRLKYNLEVREPTTKPYRRHG